MEYGRVEGEPVQPQATSTAGLGFFFGLIFILLVSIAAFSALGLAIGSAVEFYRKFCKVEDHMYTLWAAVHIQLNQTAVTQELIANLTARITALEETVNALTA
jgi:hypothetical protein